MLLTTEKFSDYRKKWDRHLDRIKNTRTPEKEMLSNTRQEGQKSNAIKKIFCILKLEEATGIIHEEKKKKRKILLFILLLCYLVSHDTAPKSRMMNKRF
jgi:hypothetical protein